MALQASLGCSPFFWVYCKLVLRTLFHVTQQSCDLLAEEKKDAGSCQLHSPKGCRTAFPCASRGSLGNVAWSPTKGEPQLSSVPPNIDTCPLLQLCPVTAVWGFPLEGLDLCKWNSAKLIRNQPSFFRQGRKRCIWLKAYSCTQSWRRKEDLALHLLFLSQGTQFASVHSYLNLLKKKKKIFAQQSFFQFLACFQQ